MDDLQNHSQNAETLPKLDEKPQVAPKWGHQFTNAEILLPIRDKIARGHVVHWK